MGGTVIYFHRGCTDGRVAAALLVAHLRAHGVRGLHVQAACATMARFAYPPADTDAIYFVDLCPTEAMVPQLERGAAPRLSRAGGGGGGGWPRATLRGPTTPDECVFFLRALADTPAADVAALGAARHAAAAAEYAAAAPYALPWARGHAQACAGEVPPDVLATRTQLDE